MVKASKKTSEGQTMSFFNGLRRGKVFFCVLSSKKHNLALSILAQVSNRASLERELPVKDLEEEEEEECLSTLTREGSGGRIWQEVSHLFLSALLSPCLARNMRTGGAGPFSLSFTISPFPSPSRPVRRQTHAVSARLYNIRHCDKNTIKQFRVNDKVWGYFVQSLFPCP